MLKKISVIKILESASSLDEDIIALFDNSELILEKVEFDVSEPDVLDKVKSAISNRYYLGFYYEEEEGSEVKSGFRLIEPYTLGNGYRQGSKISHTDRNYLRGYLIKSSKETVNKKLAKMNRKSVSKTGFAKGKSRWRMFLTNRIKNIEVFKLKIRSPRDGYNPNDSMMGTIIETMKF